MTTETVNTYRKVRVDPKLEPKIVDILMKSGQPFKAVSRTEYFISKKQCATLNSKNIPYDRL